MTLADVMAWLKTLGVPQGVEGWTIARLDASKTHRIGVWDRGAYEGTGTAIGGEASTLTHVRRVQVLVHWDRNANDTDLAAQALHDAIAAQATARPTIGSDTATYIQIVTSGAVDLGADETGTFERTIWLDIYYQ